MPTIPRAVWQLPRPRRVGDLIPVEEFCECCRTGMFLDSDGFGEWADANGKTGDRVKPSDYKCRPDWATHVVWYNN